MGIFTFVSLKQKIPIHS